MENVNPLFNLLWMIGLLAFIALVFSVVRRMSLARAEKERVDRAAQIEKAIAEGKLLPNGKPGCTICGTAEATHALPTIGLSKFERLNPLRSLYGSVKLYTRIDPGAFADNTACGACCTMYAALIDQDLANMRRDTAEFAADIDRRVSRLRGEEAILAVRAEREKSLKAIRAIFTQAPVPMLPAHHEELAVSAQTTNGKAVDEQPEMTN